MTNLVEERNSKANFANLSSATNAPDSSSVVAMDRITRATVTSLRKDLRDAVARDLRILKRHGLIP